MATKKADFRQSTAAMFLTLKDEQPEAINTEVIGDNLVTDVPISEIDDFPEHPFHVTVDDAMKEMVESVKQFGVLSPAIVRKKEDGRYELVSGHRRKKACELAGIETMPVIVREKDRDEAIIFMVDSNFQREKLLPSEKAFSYKMRLEAMKRKAGRPIKNASPMATNYPEGRSDDELAKIVGEVKDKPFTLYYPRNLLSEKTIFISRTVTHPYRKRREAFFHIDKKQKRRKNHESKTTYGAASVSADRYRAHIRYGISSKHRHHRIPDQQRI